MMTTLSSLWRHDDADRATGGRSTLPWQASGVSIDTRTIVPGDLFVALKGPNFDGHGFVVEAFAKGAAAAMVSHMPQQVGSDKAMLVLDDTLKGLEGLAIFARARTRAKVIAVTGSVGKTGVKEALRHVLGAQGVTSASVGSLNNHWGLPLSLARMPTGAAYGVLEMGMNHEGELAALSRIARPDVCLVTTVEAVHSAYFSSTREIALAKAEVFEGAAPGAIAVLNRDNPFFDLLAERAEENAIAEVIGFGRHPDADVRLEAFRPDRDGGDVEAIVRGTRIAYRLNVAGEHWALNSLGVLGCVLAAGGDVARAARDLAGVEAPKGRGARHRIAWRAGALDIIDESYNASPASMRAAFNVLAAAHPERTGRRIAVLGDMLELGDEADRLHGELADDLRRSKVDLVFTCGTHMRALSRALPHGMRAAHQATSDAMVGDVLKVLHEDDVVMIKGSHGAAMGVVVNALLRREEFFKTPGDAAREAPVRKEK